MPIFDNLPESVQIDGINYPIQSDFRKMIEFEQILTGEDEPEDRVEKSLLLFYKGNIPPDREKAIERLLWFYRCGKDEEELPKTKKDGKRIYSFQADDGFVFSAFREQYGIDISDGAPLHWWKFRFLFMSLSDQTQMSKIMGYRGVTIDGKMSSEFRKFYSDMKKVYALPLPKKEREFQKEMERRLMNGEGA